MPTSGQNRVASPISRNAPNADSTSSTLQPKNVKFGRTRCSTSQEYGGKTGYSTADLVKAYSPLGLASCPKVGGPFQPTFWIHGTATPIRTTAMSARLTRDDANESPTAIPAPEIMVGVNHLPAWREG
jgi:hypothetical protein